MSDRAFRNAERVAWAVVVVCAAIRSWVGRDLMNPDGVAYLDFANEIAHGHFDSIVAAYWSPLYPALLAILRRLRLDAFLATHVLNALLFCACLVAFHGLLRELELSAPRRFFAVSALGALTLNLITVEVVTPDLLVVLFVLLGATAAFRLFDSPSHLRAVALGVILGLGYWAKAILIIFSLVLVGALVLVRRSNDMFRRAVVALLIFGAVAAPLMITISRGVRHVSFSEVGSLNYAWYVSGVTRWVHWQGDPLNGSPVHPTRLVHDDPPVYEFASPFVRATYAPWYAPAYWYEGLHSHFDVARQVKAIDENIAEFARATLPLLSAAILAGIAFFLSARRTAHWPMLVALASIAALMLVLLLVVHVEGRLVAPFLLLFVLLVFARDGGSRERAAAMFLGAAGALLLAGVVSQTINQALWPPTRPAVLRAVAAEVSARARSHKVGVIGEGFVAYWAPLSHTRIVAETPRSERMLTKSETREVVGVMKGVGADLVVAEPQAIAPDACPQIGAIGYRLCQP